MNKVSVNVKPKPYEVVIGKNVFNHFPAKLKSDFPERQLFFVIDKKMYKLNSGIIDGLFSKIKNKKSKILISATEKNKTYDTLTRIHRKMMRANCGRDCLVIALGGGIIGDVTGFAAATYMRGVDYIQIPTTLLAMVDSSVGGKTGINLDTAKNIIGAFHQPRAVFCDLNFLRTLNREEIICGMGEIAKYSFLTNKTFYDYFLRNFDKIINLNNAVLNKVVSESVNYKKCVVEEDEKESGLRKVLNLGHTFAHAIESVYKHKIKHGQAVVAGLAMSFYLSAELNLISENQLREYLKLLDKFRNYISLPSPDFNLLYNAMHIDKKNRLNKIRFVLLKDFGKILLDVEAEKQQVLKAMRSGSEFFV